MFFLSKKKELAKKKAKKDKQFQQRINRGKFIRKDKRRQFMRKQTLAMEAEDKKIARK